MKLRNHRIIGLFDFIILCTGIFFLTSCSQNKEAAEIMNSIIHTIILGGGSQTLPNDIVSGECRNEITGGGLTTISSLTSGSTALINVITSVNLKSGCGETGKANCAFSCTYTATYGLSSDGTRLTGSGTITTCDGFSCKIRGQALSCDEFKKALLENTCTDSATF